MINYSFLVLEQKTSHTLDANTFKIERSGPGKQARLYLKLQAKLPQDIILFESPEYSDFKLDDIHVTIMPEHNISDQLSKCICPFHITLKLVNTKTSECIIIHDFYSNLDNSRDFHIQRHTPRQQTPFYLPRSILQQKNVDDLIEQEINLVKSLILLNQTHEQNLLSSIKIKSDKLYTIASQANYLPETLSSEQYIEFIKELELLIENLSELVSLGHIQEIKKLENFKSELEMWKAISPKKPSIMIESIPEKFEEKKKKAKNTSPKKPKPKKVLVSKDEEAQYLKLLDAHFNKASSLQIAKDRFIQNLPFTAFEAKQFFEYCQEHHELFETLTIEESESLVLKFFGHFAISDTPEDQLICLEISQFLSERCSHFTKHMLKLSTTSYHILGHQISPTLIAFLNNNMVFWEYMHDYGMNFSDNRHIIYEHAAGNLLQGMLILLRTDPKKFSTHLIPFVKRLFEYLDDSQSHLSNMKIITKILTNERKKIAISSFFKGIENKIDDEFYASLKFKKNLFEDPYGSNVIMNTIDTWLIRARENWGKRVEPSENEYILMPILVDLFIVLEPRLETKRLLHAFESLLELQVLGMFDDGALNKLMTLEHQHHPLEQLSHFEMTYVGAVFQTPIQQLIEFFVNSIKKRCAGMSKTVLNNNMLSFFDAAIHYKAPYDIKETSPGDIIVQAHQKLASARIAYLLFTIKIEQGIEPESIDYRVLFYFYHSYVRTELIRFNKDDPLCKHQYRASLCLIERLNRTFYALPISPELTTEVTESNEYIQMLELVESIEYEVMPLLSQENPNI